MGELMGAAAVCYALEFERLTRTQINKCVYGKIYTERRAGEEGVRKSGNCKPGPFVVVQVLYVLCVYCTCEVSWCSFLLIVGGRWEYLYNNYTNRAYRQLNIVCSE